ncbi:GntR family transcriptional regulator [Streptomyces pathocidini]|uniref:GntR family transcriptional regulator n=1 Tax=Streptomyces pathocidini TaxID=1650571 RepID=A0ABW7UXA4_9ACTN|nr:GntR family transcriptional regulator [Streptomyces pathocidini]
MVPPRTATAREKATLEGATAAAPPSAAGPAPDDSLESRAREALVEWLTKEHPAPGQPVPVREFARRLGMSRTPVRSAVGRLYERGLLAYDATAGFTVAIPSLSSLYELFELRLMLESHALRLFAERTDREPPARLRELVDEAQELARLSLEDHAHYIGFRENDSRFHRALVELGGLPRLLALHDDLHLSIHVTRTGMEAPITASRLNAAVAEHRAVVDALESGDRLGARDLLETHILRVRDQTIAFLARPRM